MELVAVCLVAIPVACVSWTIAKEELFREFREWCKANGLACEKIKNRIGRFIMVKLNYLPRCYYCTSFYVCEVFILLTGVKFVSPGWQGAVCAWFAVVFIAQVYLTLFNLLRVALRHYQAVADIAEHNRALTVDKETEVLKLAA
jgi:hypothetical protein